MSFSADIKEKISFEVIKTLVNQFSKFPEDASNNRNAPFHEAFLKAFKDKLDDKVTDVPFLLSLKNWLHGLETSLGQSFFEKTAHILSQGEKREYTSKKLGNLLITTTQKNNANEIITSLSNGVTNPSLTEENSKLFVHDVSAEVNAIDFSADVFIEDESKIIAIELKTVKPNSGEMRGEKQKILEGKTALFHKFNAKKIEFYIGFPFDPTSNENTTYDKTRFLESIINMTKYFDPIETLVACELWDLLSGHTETMDEILKIINTIATTEFLEKFQFINDKSNINNSKYSAILTEWNLQSELKLLENQNEIIEKTKTNKSLRRIFNQTPFDSKGNYKIERSNTLLSNL